MSTSNDRLDAQALRRLRRFVDEVSDHNGRPILEGPLLELAKDLDIDGTVTVDFDAAEELGRPMVVMRPSKASSTASRTLDLLSRREAEVALLVARGMTNREIAEHLHISVSTVKDHVHHILAKTGHRSRSAIIAELLGFVPESAR